MAENKEYVTQTDELGNIHISEEVLAVISAAAALEVDGVSSLSYGNKELLGKKSGLTRGVHIQMVEECVRVELAIMVKYGYAIADVARSVQDAVCANIESMSGLKVACVDVSISGVSFGKEAAKAAQ